MHPIDNHHFSNGGGVNAAPADDGAPADTLRIHFRFALDSSVIDPDFGANRASLVELREALDTRCPAVVYVYGAASPDGRLDMNLRLADRRLRSLEQYLVDRCGIPGDVLYSRGSSVPWDQFRRMVADDPRVVEIASRGSDDNPADAAARMRALRKLDGGRVWRRLVEDVFPRLRGAGVMLIVPAPQPEPEPTPAPEPEPTPEPQYEPATVAEAISAPLSEPSPAPVCGHRWAVGTNLLAWGMAVANLSGEATLGCRWSLALSLYYSGWDYASDTRKFRTFIFRPEARFWTRSALRGLYLQAHVQMAAYNFAMPSWSYRIQDVGGDHPALGGGIGLGYRLPLGNGRWALDAAIGAGVYHLKYDRFENRDNGPLVDTRSRVWAGIDHVSVGVVYNFNSALR